MKKSLRYYFIVLISMIAFGSWVLYPGGSPGGKTGSPGDGGATCTQCHTGTAQQAAGWITTNIPPEGYVPGQTYTVTATGTHNGVGKFGFETTAENGSGVKKGTFIITDASQTKLINANKAVTHTSSGTTPFGSTKSWSFDWTAPEAGTGTITFYAAFNAANGNGSTSGDVIYVTETAVNENLGVGIDEDIVKASGLKAFPNPATRFADISWDGSAYKLERVNIYNLAGSLVDAQVVSDPQSGIYRVNLDGLLQGMYFIVSGFDNGQQATISLVKR